MAIWSRNGNFPSIPRRRRLFSFVGQTTIQNHPIPSYQASTMTLSSSHRSIRRIPDPTQHCSSSPLNLQCSSTATTAHRTPRQPAPQSASSQHRANLTARSRPAAAVQEKQPALIRGHSTTPTIHWLPWIKSTK